MLAAVLLVLPCAAVLPLGARSIRPAPQHYTATSSSEQLVELRGWSIVAGAHVGALPLALLVNATAGRRAGGLHGLSPQQLPQETVIAAGVMPAGHRGLSRGDSSDDDDDDDDDDDVVVALAAAHGVSMHPTAAASAEGYTLVVRRDVVLVLGSSEAGVFYGVQSLLQLLAGGTTAPACRVDDWPDFPIRGALMSEMTELNNLDKVGVSCWDRSPPHTSGGFCAHFNYTLRLVDWMVENKMNFGVPDVPWLGTDSYFNVVPGINPNATQAAWIKARLQELHQYMQERHVQFVPDIHSPDGNSLFDPRMVEGKWVRNQSFTFDETTGEATPTPTGSPTLTQQLNGDFARLGADGRPLGWSFTNSSALSHRGARQWAVDSHSAPWSAHTVIKLYSTILLYQYM
jgi:hypothetical protein